MREYIKSRNAEYNKSDDLLIMACTVHEKLIVQDGYGLAAERTKDEWKAITLTASISLELCESLRTEGINPEQEILNVLIHEIKNEVALKDYSNIAYINFSSGINKSFMSVVKIVVGCV